MRGRCRIQGPAGILWALDCTAAPLQGITLSPLLVCPIQMRSSIPGLGRVMVFLAAALASASFAIPEDWEEEGETPTKHPHRVPLPMSQA